MTKPAVLLASLLLVGACGTAGHNDADVDFATDMIEHHAQAIQMANYTIGRTGIDPRIAELAEEIRIAQTEEIDTLGGWLRDWGEPVPETGFATGDAHSHDMDAHSGPSHPDMPGMMSADEMEELAAAPDDEFGRMWIQMMIEHHQGAITMAKDLQEEGEHDDLGALAEDIEETQRVEVKDLQGWLDAT